MTWQPITADDDQARGEDGEPMQGQLFGWNGAAFPRLSLYVVRVPRMKRHHLHVDAGEPSLHIYCQEQLAYDKWWEQRLDVPWELVPKLVELIEEALKPDVDFCLEPPPAPGREVL
jgi:hypothetical protein